MSTVGRKPRGFRKTTVSLAPSDFTDLEWVVKKHPSEAPDQSAAIRWLIARARDSGLIRAGSTRKPKKVIPTVGGWIEEVESPGQSAGEEGTGHGG